MAESVLLAQLQRVIADLRANPTGKAADRSWSQVQRLLANLQANPARFAPIMRSRNVDDLAAFYQTMVQVEAQEQAERDNASTSPADAQDGAEANAKAILRGEAAPDADAPSPSDGPAKRHPATNAGPATPVPPAVEEVPPTPDELKQAYAKFKRRLKTTQRDEDSHMGNRYTTSGGRGVVAVSPPTGFRPIVWRTLVEQGRLKRAGKGLYQMP